MEIAVRFPERGSGLLAVPAGGGQPRRDSTDTDHRKGLPMRLSLIASLATLLAALGTADAAAQATPCDDGETVIRFSHLDPARGNARGEGAAALAERVNFELDGRACMIVTAEATDHTPASLLDRLQDGTFDMTAAETGTLAALSPRFQIYDLPFLFDDVQAVLAFQRSNTGSKLLGEGDAEGVTGLAFWLDGFKQMTANRAIREPGDMAGLVMNTRGSEVEQATMRLLGAEPDTLPLSEVAEALGEGRLDGQASSWSAVRSQGIDRVQAGFTETRHSVVQYMLMASTDFWESLDPALRADLEQLVALVSHERNRFAFELNESAKYMMRANGTRIVELDPVERLAWKRAMQDVWFSFGGNIGFDQISAALHANRFN